MGYMEPNAEAETKRRKKNTKLPLQIQNSQLALQANWGASTFNLENGFHH
jgi:hypothetical protein